ncbi:MAG: methyltransferase domain-containing protein [Myxococcota bacterium]|nr:methyltransferase domain-containing protein [Myxococcota bacterium]
MPGHWLLARVGKRVLRPGGRELTERMLAALGIGANDRVVEFAPGLGVTARMTLERRPASYTGVERDEAAAASVRRLLSDPRDRCLVGTAMATGLPDASATAVYGEAMLTMHTAAQKAKIIQEAFRVLEPGGSYGIHEMSLESETLDDALKNEVTRELSAAIHVGVRPLSCPEWRAALEAEGFVVEAEHKAPMLLLETGRVLGDEGFGGTLRICWNLLRMPVALRRVLQMRSVFRRHQRHLGAITLVARKPSAPDPIGSGG